MAWPSPPKTWVALEELTAALLNAQIRDALNILKTCINNSGRVNFEASTELTIATGSITVTQNFHTVDTESDAATDDLDTITAGTSVAEGFLLTVMVENTARDVVLKDGTGNLSLGRDITLTGENQMALLVYDGTNWRVVTMAGGVKSIQRGTITVSGATTNTATITAVVVAKSLVSHLGQQCATNDAAQANCHLDLTNTTTITATRGTTSGAATVSFEVVEFY